MTPGPGASEKKIKKKYARAVLSLRKRRRARTPHSDDIVIIIITVVCGVRSRGKLTDVCVCDSGGFRPNGFHAYIITAACARAFEYLPVVVSFSRSFESYRRRIIYVCYEKRKNKTRVSAAATAAAAAAVSAGERTDRRRYVGFADTLASFLAAGVYSLFNAHAPRNDCTPHRRRNRTVCDVYAYTRLTYDGFKRCTVGVDENPSRTRRLANERATIRNWRGRRRTSVLRAFFPGNACSTRQFFFFFFLIFRTRRTLSSST